ncbi:LysE family translocator [Acinetobacter nectaris]|uniref:LysE family translocator n=1 Tax=Acinetobacter nectaris TaxID=1219382 RepID=UPI001F344633|nr:LysE family translocator [Acinetobacter nectaris]MCF9000142.1 LysE family translocator [Acinetobacter nectaris]MCF9028513.1 LysE family translocator [Acinetobacter nectaris]
MTVYAFFSFILYCFVTSITPGPNNIMLLSSGLNFGFKSTIPHILGVGIGFSIMVILVGLGIGNLLTSSQIIYESIKAVGIIYLIYLAYQLLKSDIVDEKEIKQTKQPITFLQAALFQWVNPKAWVMVIGAVTTYISHSSSLNSFIFLGLVYGLVNIPSIGLWAYVGNKLKKFIKNKQKIQIFNIVMASMLLLSICYPMYEVVIFFLG